MSTEKNIANQPDQHRLREKGLIFGTIGTPTTPLPLPADTAVDYTSDIDLGFALPNVKDARLEDVWVNVEIPAMTVAIFRNANVLTVNIFAGAAAAPTTEIIGSAIVVTGVTAVDPSLPISRNFKLPADCARYVRLGVSLATSEAGATVYDLTGGLVF